MGTARRISGILPADAACRRGTSIGTFKNKQGIGEEVVRDYMASEEADMAKVLAEPGVDFETRLRRFFHRAVEGLMRELRQNPNMVELADMIMQGNSGILARHVEWKRLQVEALLREGVEAGKLDVDPPGGVIRALRHDEGIPDAASPGPDGFRRRSGAAGRRARCGVGRNARPRRLNTPPGIA